MTYNHPSRRMNKTTVTSGNASSSTDRFMALSTPPKGMVWVPQILTVVAGGDTNAGTGFCTVYLGPQLFDPQNFVLPSMLCPNRVSKPQTLPFVLYFATLNDSLRINTGDFIGVRVGGAIPANTPIISVLNYQELREEDAELMEL